MPEQFLLSIRPKPLPDELCSSWLLRLASGSGMTMYAFRRVLSPRIFRTPVYDFDRSVGIYQLQPIADATVTPTEVVRSTLLRFDDDGGKGSPWLETWLLPVGSAEYTKERIGYQYCPECLASGVPYFRKRWCFSLFTACTEHKTQFVDECGRCGAPIHGFAIGLAGLERVLTPNGEVPFVRCVACGWDLRGRGPTCGQADDQVLATQKTHEDLLSQSNRGGGDPSDYSWLLQHAVELFSKELGTLQFGFLKARHRASVLQRAAWLLQDDRWRYISSIRTTAGLHFLLEHEKSLPGRLNTLTMYQAHTPTVVSK